MTRRGFGKVQFNLNCSLCEADAVVEVSFDFADYNGNGIVDVEIVEANCKCEPHFNGDLEAEAEELFLGR